MGAIGTNVTLVVLRALHNEHHCQRQDKVESKHITGPHAVLIFRWFLTNYTHLRDFGPEYHNKHKWQTCPFV